MIRDALDTFLHFLSDNLATQGITVHPVRRQSTDANADRLAMNALNVCVMAADPDIHISVLQLSLDVVNDDDLTAIDWVDKVWTLLSAALMTQKQTYTSGSAVALPSNIFWNKSVKFIKVHSDFYAHYSCKMTIKTSNF